MQYICSHVVMCARKHFESSLCLFDSDDDQRPDCIAAGIGNFGVHINYI